MELLCARYVPDWNEGLFLSNRRIFTDQMAFLLARVPDAAGCTTLESAEHQANDHDP